MSQDKPHYEKVDGADLLIAIVAQWGKVPPGFLYFQF